MRISIRKEDKGYNRNAIDFSAYLNGKIIDSCFTADEELGEMWAFRTGEDGQLLEDDAGNLIEDELSGRVEIRKDVV